MDKSDDYKEAKLERLVWVRLQDFSYSPAGGIRLPHPLKRAMQAEQNTKNKCKQANRKWSEGIREQSKWSGLKSEDKCSEVSRLLYFPPQYSLICISRYWYVGQIGNCRLPFVAVSLSGETENWRLMLPKQPFRRHIPQERKPNTLYALCLPSI